ncbi:hypothetical protein HY622_00095 [Candidatus Uhrbacteria bacterium]|nr:hypothetical protein [Candidatus Uhrbacteria bacterium]
MQFRAYLNIITPAFMVRVLPEVFEALILEDEFAELEDYRTFAEAVLESARKHSTEQLKFDIAYENVDTVFRFKYQTNDDDMSGRFQHYVRLWIGYGEHRAAILLRIAAVLRGKVSRYTWSEGDLEIGLPSGTALHYRVRVVEATFVDRAEAKTE